MDITQITVGRETYNSTGYSSENILTEAGLMKGDELTSTVTLLNSFIRDESPFMWLNAGYKGYSHKELTGDGQFYWPVMGQIKEHDMIVGSPYSGSDKPGIGLSQFSVYMTSNWIKEGWLMKFRDGYLGRVYTLEDKGDYWLYTVTPYDTDADNFCSLENLQPGNLVREGVYLVPNRFDVGTESNSQTPAKRTNQISKVRFAHGITGNIANKQVATFKFPSSKDGQGDTTYWVDWDYWVTMAQNEKKLERFLFEESIYNRDRNGAILPNHNDRRSGGEPIMTGASIKQMIHAQGNYASYGIGFTIDFWERTVNSITYGKTKNIDLIGYCGQMYMNDFSDAIEVESNNKGYQVAEGEQRITTTSNGLVYKNTNFVQYTTRFGHRVTLIHMPYLDAAGQTEQPVHPRTGRPMSSHSCYYIAQGLDGDGQDNVQLISEKGEAKVQGIYQGLTNIPRAWGSIGSGGMSMIQLATERNEASIHERRSVGINIRNTEMTFHHYSDIELL